MPVHITECDDVRQIVVNVCDKIDTCTALILHLVLFPLRCISQTQSIHVSANEIERHTKKAENLGQAKCTENGN